MSVGRSAQRLQIECHGYRRLRVLFAGCMSMAAGCLLMVPLSWPVTAFSLMLLGLLARYTWQLRCELGGKPVMLLWDSEGRWWWRQNGEEIELRLAGDSYLSTWLIVLNFHKQPGEKGRAMLVFPSGQGGELFRRLTVRLRLEARMPPESSGFADAK